MKRLWIAAVAAGWTWAAQAGMGIVWSTCGWIVEAGGDTDAGPGVAENNVITWQLLYAGANNVPDAINPSATGWTGGDDILLAERVVPAGGGTAADGTSWDSLLMQQGGDTTYEDLTWPEDRGGFVFQRVFQGTPSDGTPYAESGLFAFNPAFAGNGALPDHFYFPADGYGLVLDRAVTTTPPVPYWDPVNHTTNTCETYAPYTGQTTLTRGWYVLAGDITNNTRIAVDGDVHLILMDGASLTANAGVNVASNECFTIWAQSDGPGMGTVTAQGNGNAAGIGAAGIGGGSGETAGRVTINGGTVNATGRSGGAGIGGGVLGMGGTVTVNGGAITAIAGEITVINTSPDVEVEISGPKAIGNGVFIFDATITISIDEGGLDFPENYCAYSPETATTPVDAANRMAACRGNRVKLTRCDPHGAAYRNNGADHTAHCPYCGAEGATEPHVFEDGVCACGALEPGVTDVVAEPGAPGSGTVTISFNVTNSPAAVCPGWNAPVLSIVATDNLTGSNYVSDVSALSARAPYQLADALAGSNGTHSVTWDMGAQGIDFSSTNVTFTVAYLRMPDYCVIDLSGGTNAESYAVSYLDAEPEGGWTDLYKTTNLVMRLLAPGTFTMGVDGSYHGNQSHSVTLTQPFYCAVFETTQKQWELVKGDRPSHYTNETYYATRPVEIVKWNMIRGDAGTYNWPNVKDVDPESFLGVLRLKTGLTSLDLPTEAQWEYACRAGTVTHFNNGKNLTGDNYDTNLNEVARYSYNGGLPNPSSFHAAARDCETNFATAVVGSYKPNLWGLYDMHGNVCEWCLDWWDGNLDGTSVTNPPGSSSGSRRVIRGGGLSSDPSGCTSSRRGGYNPPSAGINIGFRLVRTLSDNPESERSAEAAAGAERAGTVCAGTSAPIAVGMREFADTDIKLTPYDAPYDGQPHTIGVETNAVAGLELKYAVGRDASTTRPGGRFVETSLPEYVNVTNVVIYVEASAPGYFTKTNSAAVKITPRSIADAAIEPIPVQYFEGEALTPAVSVLCGGRQLAVGVDFDASYTANDAPGTGTVTLTGMGNYTNEASATFQILPAPRSLAVTAGRWGRVAVVVDGATNWIAAGAADVPVGYGSSVTVAAVPDAGFAAAGPAGDLSFSSYTENTNLVFSFVPNPAATLRWKFSSAVGRYFAQVAIPAHAGYAEALGGLAFLFADRTNAVGDVYAQLWDAAARAPQGVLLTDGGVAYRGVALDPVAFAGKAENARVLWGVADASFNESRNIVPAGERQIGLYVRKRVDPVSGNETAAEVGNFLGYLTWVTDDKRWFLPMVEGAANGAAHSSLFTLHSSLAFAAPRAYAPATLNAALALGLDAEAVADNPPKTRIADFTVAADGSISGRVEAVAGGEASSRFGAATVRILSAETPAGPWREVRAEVDQATGAFALPAGAVTGHFFRAEVETRAVLE